VESFLRQLGLELYLQVFLQHGFDEMDTLRDTEDDDMRQLGMHPLDIKLLRQNLESQAALASKDVLADNPVTVFLRHHGLGEHAAKFVQSGFDELDVLFEVEETDLKDLGLTRGHALKFRRHLRELQRQRESSHTLPRRVPSQAPSPSPAHPQLAATEQMKCDVIKSWERVQELGTLVVGEVLYKHTFKLAPQAIALFPPHVLQKYRQVDFFDEESDLKDGPALRKLFSVVLNAVGSAVAGLQKDIGTLVSMLTNLGARHQHYGVNAGCWEVLGQALKLTLQDVLREAFTHEVEQAWGIVYGFISSIMVQGMHDAIALSHGTEIPAEDADDLSSLIGQQGTC